MRAFFEGTRPGRVVRFGSSDVELPALYYRDDSFGALFSADLDQLRGAMPSDQLHPVPMVRRGRGFVYIGAFNYLDTSSGPYGEVAVVVPAVYGSRPPPLVPSLLETRWPGFGAVVLHMPVTRRLARDVGRGQWGYAKFLAEMQFQRSPEHEECKLHEAGEHILTLRVLKRGVALADRRPVVTYSVKDRELIRTTLSQRALVRTSLGSGGGALALGNVHPVAQAIRQLGIDPRPVMTRYLLDRVAVLPQGQVIERNVRPLDGYFGADREAGALHAVERPPMPLH